MCSNDDSHQEREREKRGEGILCWERRKAGKMYFGAYNFWHHPYTHVYSHSNNDQQQEERRVEERKKPGDEDGGREEERERVQYFHPCCQVEYICAQRW